MSRLFKFLLPFLFISSFSTAHAGPTQPHPLEVVSASASRPVEVSTDQGLSSDISDRQIWGLLLIFGGATLFFGTYRIAGGIKKSHSATLYLAKVYLSQKDVLWKS